MMNFLRNNWYKLGLLLFVMLAFGALFAADRLSTLQKLLLASLMALPIHQYEEYALPGGAAPIINLAIYGYNDNFRHYPGNWHSCMLVNLLAYIFYLAAFLLPHCVWLGMATMLFNLTQLLGHGIRMNVVLKTWYNPGMATALCLLTPISIAYFVCLFNSTPPSSADWIAALICLIAMLLITIIAPVQLLKDVNSPYDIPDWQMEQFRKVTTFAAINKATLNTKEVPR